MTGPGCRRRLSTPLLGACALWAGLAAEAAAQGSVASDGAVLEALYDATGGPDWIDNMDWKTSAPLGEWSGVTTDPAGRVTRLELPGNGLAGPIPPALGELALLRVLDLGSRWDSAAQQLVENELTGPIPDALGNLASLESLELGHNGLTGPIPAALGRLSNLSSLSLDGNELTGRIPDVLGDLASLAGLDLGRNGLTGPIPAVLGGLSNLRWLRLGGNELTGRIPDALGNLANLWFLDLGRNELTGRIPDALGNLANLQWLWLGSNGLTGSIPAALGSLVNLERLDLSYSWGLSGRLPPGLRLPRLEELDIVVTRACAPSAWRVWLATIEFTGRPCDVDVGTDVTIDVAVVYTPAVRAAMGGTVAVEAEIDLMVAETNQAYAQSGAHHRLALVERSEVAYTETGDMGVDFGRLQNPSDGHLDEAHALRDRLGADLVHLMVSESSFAGTANLNGPFSAGVHSGRRGSRAGGAILFAHELGHNLGLLHDRYSLGRSFPHPAYGYVNQRALAAGSAKSSHWVTTMAYGNQCRDAGFSCGSLLRFSNPRRRYNGDPLGIAFGVGSGVTGPADAAAVLNVTGPTVAAWRARPGANHPPAAGGTLPDRRMTLHSTLEVDVSQAFVDPDGDALTYTVSSSSPDVVTVLAAGARVTLTSVGEGMAPVRVTATDPGGLSAVQSFTVTVRSAANRPPEVVGMLAPLTIGVNEAAVMVEVGGSFRDPDGDALSYGASSSSPSVVTVSVLGSQVTVAPVSEGTALVTVTATDVGGSNTPAMQSFTVMVLRRPFTDHAIVAGETPVRAIHFTELRTRIDTLRSAAGLGQFVWTDPVLRPGVTRVRLVHLLELRSALAAAYRAAGQSAPSWTDLAPAAGTTPIRAAHLLELREAVLALE